MSRVYYPFPDYIGPPVLMIDNLFEIQSTTEMALFDLGNMEWDRREGVPRSELYWADGEWPYSYGKAPHAREYVPSTQWPEMVLLARNVMREQYDLPDLNLCFANRYDGPRDQLGWHADDSPTMDHAFPIVTVSFGEERDIEFRRVGGVIGCVERLTLKHGSACVMLPHMQREWQHRIRKSSHADFGTRISLTFRRYLPPTEITTEALDDLLVRMGWIEASRLDSSHS